MLAGCQVTSTPFGLLVDKDLVSFEVPWACVWAPGEAANKGMSLQLSANVEELQKLGVLDNEVAERVGQNTAVMLVESRSPAEWHSQESGSQEAPLRRSHGSPSP